MSKTTFGRAGEQYAARFLKKKGYRILAQNYIAGGGELDIVALQSRTLIFVEVKTRSDTSFGTPTEAVGEKKIACLRSAAAAFLREQCRDGRVTLFHKFGLKTRKKFKETRYDIIEIYSEKGAFSPYQVNHIENAF